MSVILSGNLFRWLILALSQVAVAVIAVFLAHSWREFSVLRLAVVVTAVTVSAAFRAHGWREFSAEPVPFVDDVTAAVTLENLQQSGRALALRVGQVHLEIDAESVCAKEAKQDRRLSILFFQVNLGCFRKSEPLAAEPSPFER